MTASGDQDEVVDGDGGRQPRRGKGVAIAHTMLASENFEQCAARLFQTVAEAQRVSPGAPRFLYLDVEGHRNDEGGYDRDAFEVIGEFALGFLMPYLTEITTPLLTVRNPKPQDDGIPELLVVRSEAARRPAVEPKSGRRATPSVARIAERLGLADATCLVCGGSRVERAHIVPHALGGTSDVGNFALLCATHHRAAPDVADPKAFWEWVDAAYSRWHDDARTFGDEVMTELAESYGWTEATFTAALAAIDDVRRRFRELVAAETTTHFGVGRTASTVAWAWDTALTDVLGPRPRSFEG